MQGIAMHRNVKITLADRSIDGELVIGPIEQLADDRWACCWSLTHLHEDTSRIYGGDPIEAVERCLQFLGTFLVGSAADGCDVSWLSVGDTGGISSRLSIGVKESGKG